MSAIPGTIQNLTLAQTIPRSIKYMGATKQRFNKMMERSIFMLLPLYLVTLLHIYKKATTCNFLDLKVELSPSKTH